MLWGKTARDSVIDLWLPNCTRYTCTILLTMVNFRTYFPKFIITQLTHAPTTLPYVCIGPPSSPTSLVINPLDGTSDGRHVVMLEWSPPLDDGGAAVTSYEIFVDDMIVVVTTATTRVDLTFTSGEHLVDIRGHNCAGYSANISLSTIICEATNLISVPYVIDGLP